MKLRIQGQSDLIRIDSHHLLFVVIRTPKLGNDFSKHIVPTRTDISDIGGDELMDSKYISHFDIQCWLSPGVKVVEFINVKLSLSILDRYHYKQ